MSRHDPCAMCEHFRTAGYPDQAREGKGRCTGFEQPGKPLVFVDASGPWCWNFDAAKDNVVERRAFLAKHTEASC